MEGNYCEPCGKYRNGKCHRQGYHWSERLGKCRRPAIRKFMADRQGIHIVLGVATGLLWAIPAVLALLTANGIAVIASGLAVAVVTNQINHLFLTYETVEAKEIGDDGYIDIGGYLTGYQATSTICLVALAVVAIMKFAL